MGSSLNVTFTVVKRYFEKENIKLTGLWKLNHKTSKNFAAGYTAGVHSDS